MGGVGGGWEEGGMYYEYESRGSEGKRVEAEGVPGSSKEISRRQMGGRDKVMKRGGDVGGIREGVGWRKGRKGGMEGGGRGGDRRGKCAGGEMEKEVAGGKGVGCRAKGRQSRRG